MKRIVFFLFLSVVGFNNLQEHYCSVAEKFKLECEFNGYSNEVASNKVLISRARNKATIKHNDEMLQKLLDFEARNVRLEELSSALYTNSLKELNSRNLSVMQLNSAFAGYDRIGVDSTTASDVRRGLSSSIEKQNEFLHIKSQNALLREQITSLKLEQLKKDIEFFLKY